MWRSPYLSALCVLTSISQAISSPNAIHPWSWVEARAEVSQAVGELHKFITRPDIAVPIWDLKIHDESALASGYWFVAPYGKLDQVAYEKWNGPHIYDGKGQLVWSGASIFKHLNAFDFRAVEMNGEQMATLNLHKEESGFILDNTYKLRQKINMVSSQMTPWLRSALRGQKKANFHDFSVIEDGARLLMLTRTYENSTIEESKLVGFDGRCSARWEGFVEMDLATKEPVFEWSSHGHIGLDESTWSLSSIDEECGKDYPNGWGITHVNAIDKFPDGDYLISARHTDTLYKISHIDGSIVWRLGGVKSDFEFVPADSKFSRQHHTRVVSQNRTHTLVSLFDNAHSDDPNDTPSNWQSRSFVFALRTDVTPMTATAFQKFTHPDGLAVPKRGSAQLLPNGNMFTCWSEASAITEHTPDGRLLLEAKFKLQKASSYRGYKFDWIGRPSAPPDVHAVSLGAGDDACTLVHVSWNGATDVAQWKVYQTNANGGSKELLESAERSGFETRLLLRGHNDYVVVEAIDIDGNTMGKSDVFKTIHRFNPLDPGQSAPTSIWSDDQGSRDGSALMSANSLIGFLVGVASCAITILAMRYGRQCLQRDKSRLWIGSRTVKYEPLYELDDDF